MYSYVILCEESNGCVRLLIAITFQKLSVVETHMFWTTYVVLNNKEKTVLRAFQNARIPYTVFCPYIRYVVMYVVTKGYSDIISNLNY